MFYFSCLVFEVFLKYLNGDFEQLGIQVYSSKRSLDSSLLDSSLKLKSQMWMISLREVSQERRELRTQPCEVSTFEI